MGTMRLGVLLILLCGSLMLAACAVGNQSDASDPHPNMSHLEDAMYATPENPVVSQSGLYVLVIEPGFANAVYDNRFLVYTADDEAVLVYESDERYRTRDRLLFWWDENDGICVYSGDTGTAVWARDDGANTWARR